VEENMTINLSMPVQHELKPRITVVGVGGAGGNAVNNMITSHLEGVEFVVANTDAQVLSKSLAERRIQLGVNITHGLGAGARPEIGRAAAEEAIDEILDQLQGSHMVFITAGMGGGTGTGAAPVIARAVREAGILTVGVVTKPFEFEGKRRMRLAESGLEELQQYVDTLIVIPNQNLFRIATERTTFHEAFAMADQVLHMGVRGVTDLMVMPGLINLDFNDIRTVMSEMGKAMMGTGEAEGDRRAIEAAEAAISNPLLDEVSMRGACGVLINITGGQDMTLFEVDAAANRIKEEVDPNANIIFGSTFDDTLDGRMRVSVVATGIEAGDAREARAAEQAQEPVQEPAAEGGHRFRFQPRVTRPQPYPAPPRQPGAHDAAQQPAPRPGDPVPLKPRADQAAFTAQAGAEPDGGAPRETAQQGPAHAPAWQRPGGLARTEGRAPSIFERMGLTRMRQEQPQEGEGDKPRPAPHAGGQPGGQSGPRTVERVAAGGGDDDVYDIPTFLRR
jgi:cell division protein FtsZ